MKYLLVLLCCLFLSAEPAPDISFVTMAGETKKLSDYKGQVVYLSLWASWCGPCRKNFAKYNSIRKHLKSKGVVLLNVSIDKNSENWEETIESLPYINGINALASDIPQVQRDYDISKIPDYHIINKAGNFVYLSDDANRDIIMEFEKWINE